jgi:hypothetical protein
MLNTIRTGDDVKVTFRWVVEKLRRPRSSASSKRKTSWWSRSISFSGSSHELRPL